MNLRDKLEMCHRYTNCGQIKTDKKHKTCVILFATDPSAECGELISSLIWRCGGK